jgi:hypothetical protein
VIRRQHRMTGRLVRPLRLPGEEEAGPRPVPLPLLRAPNEWMDAAACARPEVSGLPWIADGEQVEPADTEAMAAVCGGCPVRVACSRFIKPGEVTAGFWSGRHRDSHAKPRRPKLARWRRKGPVPGMVA